MNSKQSQTYTTRKGEQVFILSPSDKPVEPVNVPYSENQTLFGDITRVGGKLIEEKETPLPSWVQTELDRTRDRQSLDFDEYIRNKTDNYDADLMRLYGAEFDVHRGLAVPVGSALGNYANNGDRDFDKPNFSRIPFSFYLQKDFKFDDSHEKKTRSLNYATRKRLQHYQIQTDRAITCGTDTIDGDTTVFIDSETEACRVDNIETCSSVWACPVCRHKILNQRQNDLNEVSSGYRSDGGNITLLTLTIPHKKAHKYHESKDGILENFKRFRQSKMWRSFKDEIGLDGYARALETTYSIKNGFHPHIHILLFHSEKINYRSVKHSLFEQWNFLCKKYLHRECTFQHGVDIRESEKEDYLAKWGGANELTSQSAKSGKEFSYSIADLEKFVLYPESLKNHKFDSDALRSLEKVLSILYEYYYETKGNRLLTYSQSRYKDSKSLKDHYLKDEKSDDEIVSIQDDEIEKLIPVMKITKEGWNEIYQHEHCTELKEIAEKVQFDMNPKLSKYRGWVVNNLIYECFTFRYPQYKKYITPLFNFSEYTPRSVRYETLLIDRKENQNRIVQDLESCRHNSKLPKNHPNYIPF